MKYNNIGIILVRSGSTRLNNKCFLKFGKVNVIEHIILRCKFYKIKPVICTSILKNDNKIIYFAKKHKVKYFRGSKSNLIKRINDCCKLHKISYFHTVDADDPFFCGKEVIRSIKILKNKNLDIVKPSTVSSKGAAIMGHSMTFNAIKRINSKVKTKENTEFISNSFKLVKNLNIKKMDSKKDYKLIRMTLDYFEDYILLEIVRSNLGNYASRMKIENFFKKYSFLKKINNFRNKHWKINQLKMK